MSLWSHLTSADVGRFPALLRLGVQRKIPFIAQVEAADCGATCLAMILRYHGLRSGARPLARSSGRGTSAADLLERAHAEGLRGRGVRVEDATLADLPPASILHWEFNHFVVFERVVRRGVVIVDPALGRRVIAREQFVKSFTGVALVFDAPPRSRRRAGGAADQEEEVWGQLLRAFLHHPGLWRIVMTSLVLRVIALLVPLLIGYLVDRAVPSGATDALLVLGGGAVFALVFLSLTELVRGHFFIQLRTELDVRLTVGMLDHLIRLPMSFFQLRSTGDILMRVNSNATVRDTLTSSTLAAVLDGAFVSLYLALMVAVDPTIAGVVVVCALIKIGLFLAVRSPIADASTEAISARAHSQGLLNELVAGIVTLKCAGAENRTSERWSNLFVDELNATIRGQRLQVIYKAAMESLAVAAPLAVLVLGGLRVLSGDLSLGVLLALNALALGFLQPLRNLLESTISIAQLGAHLQRIDDVLRTEPEPRGDVGATMKMSLRGAIRVDGVSFAYDGERGNAVSDVSLAIEPGQTVALVGRSGSGKSTLARLLTGLYHPQRGQITIDTHDLRSLDLPTLRRRIGVVTQEPYLFDASIRDNIALAAPDAPLGAVVKAAQRAKVDDDVRAMPMGYETLVGNGGGALSGGQRQRIALARAMLTEPSVLLLDEATSALDTITETEVMRELDRVGATRIVIAHRLSTIVNADRIVVLDRGRVVEEGSHDELLARGELYPELIAAQESGPRDGVRGR